MAVSVSANAWDRNIQPIAMIAQQKQKIEVKRCRDGRI
jgi:hypothetical protein